MIPTPAPGGNKYKDASSRKNHQYCKTWLNWDRAFLQHDHLIQWEKPSKTIWHQSFVPLDSTCKYFCHHHQKQNDCHQGTKHMKWSSCWVYWKYVCTRQWKCPTVSHSPHFHMSEAWSHQGSRQQMTPAFGGLLVCALISQAHHQPPAEQRSTRLMKFVMQQQLAVHTWH